MCLSSRVLLSTVEVKVLRLGTIIGFASILVTVINVEITKAKASFLFV